MAKLYYRYGAMNSGKTTALLQVAFNYNERGMRVLILKASVDTKGGDHIVSRLGVSHKVDVLVSPDMDILDIVRADTAAHGSAPACVLCDESQSLDYFKDLFDFRPVSTKRVEFNSMRNKIKSELIKQHGNQCMINYPHCDIQSGIEIDHLIPLSTNQLNKSLRNIPAQKGKKVVTQSFGSNCKANLIVACSKCNNHKKHRILDREKMLVILIAKSVI